MTPKQIQEKVIKILAENLNIDPKKITPSSRLVEDLGVDSFSAIEIMFEIGDRFGIDLTDKDLKEIRTFGDIIRFLENRLLPRDSQSG